MPLTRPLVLNTSAAGTVKGGERGTGGRADGGGGGGVEVRVWAMAEVAAGAGAGAAAAAIGGRLAGSRSTARQLSDNCPATV